MVCGDVGVKGVTAPGVEGRRTVWVRAMGLLVLARLGEAGVLVGVVGVETVEAGAGMSYFWICEQ